MKAIIFILLVLVSPLICFALGQKTLAAFTGLYVLFSLPSVYLIAVDCIKNKSLPKIVGGPSFQFGKWKI